MTLHFSLPTRHQAIGLSQDNWHKCHRLGTRESPLRRSKYLIWANLLPTGNRHPLNIHSWECKEAAKYSVFRLDVGNFFWGSKSSTCKIRIIDVVYNTSNNELVHTKALVKNCIMLIDSTWDGQWYKSHPGPQDGGQTNS